MGLFSVTLNVKALNFVDTVYNNFDTLSIPDFSITLRPSDSGIYCYVIPYGSFSNGSGSIGGTVRGTAQNYYTYSIELYMYLPFSCSINDIKPNDYYAYAFGWGSGTVPAGVSNIHFKDSNGKLIASPANGNYSILKGSDFLGTSNSAGMPLYLCFDYQSRDYDDITTQSSRTLTFTGVTFPRYFAHVDNQYKEVIETHDTQTISELEDLNDTSADTNQTTHSIFDSISDFFGSFFSNLIGVFVPEDGFFTTWFNNLNTMLEAKLGILYWPFAKIISFLTRCGTAFSSQGTSTDIVFPAIEFTNQATGDTYTFLSAQHINLADYNVTTASSDNSTLVGSSGFGSLVDIIRTFNAFVIVFCLLSLLRTKLNLILRGDNNDN